MEQYKGCKNNYEKPRTINLFKFWQEQYVSYFRYEVILLIESTGIPKIKTSKPLTKRNISKQIAFLINDTVHSAPNIHMAIDGGKVSVSAKDINSIIHFYQTSLFKDFPTMKLNSLSQPQALFNRYWSDLNKVCL